MGIVEEAKRELGSGIVAYTEFVLDFKKEDPKSFCFYEGQEDRCYYSLRVKTILDDLSYVDYVLNGKENVLKVIKMIEHHAQYKIARTLYFIDSDFDDNQQCKNTYVTNCYSIENLYTSSQCLQNVLINEFGVAKNSDTFTKIVEEYNKCQSEYHGKTITLNAWLACQADLRKETGNVKRSNIDSLIQNVFPNQDFDNCVSNDFKIVNFPIVLEEQDGIESIFSDYPTVNKEVLENKVNEFASKNKSCIFRGKFELRLLVSFLKTLQDQICRKKDPLYGKKHKCSLRFERNTILSQLSHNATTPPCLIGFLKERKTA